MTGDASIDSTGETTDDAGSDGERTGNEHVCRDTGREQGLIGKYDIWLCRQSFRELAREMGFRKYD
ncbi:30S ribosomal protein S14 [Natronorubrum thiooxidans]|uniref:Small ribosomal subunit protein uS14 n=1 Tax=Natronorubrum thiooxidans TaxID=308853 RepID=A0A1N7H5B5_9EURY|nr:30S ribosomal protein S14 [Natronorubrum thiooxidans]SIS19858.1 small subunit ribosomal protein S14 [Natronorubrum thiooxidans]